VCETNQSGPLPQHPVIGHTPAFAVFPVEVVASSPESVRSLPPPINSVRSIAGEFRSPSPRVLSVQLEIHL
jgi:hypothetical protein